MVHYGLVASGVHIEDASLRDKLKAQHGVICIESEAAGLMDNFPCLVIRGVCNYADAHRNIKWISFAAFTAAAYGKELLSVLPVASMEQTPTILASLGTGLFPRSWFVLGMLSTYTLYVVIDKIRMVRSAVVDMGLKNKIKEEGQHFLSRIVYYQS